MHNQSILALLCAFFSLVSLSAAEDLQKRSFSVKREANPNFVGRNGPRALVKTYRKFLMPLPDGLIEAMEAQDKKQAAAAAKRAVEPSNTPSQGTKRGLIDQLIGNLIPGANANANANAAGAGAGNGNRPAATSAAATAPAATPAAGRPQGQQGQNPQGGQTGSRNNQTAPNANAGNRPNSGGNAGTRPNGGGNTVGGGNTNNNGTNTGGNAGARPNGGGNTVGGGNTNNNATTPIGAGNNGTNTGGANRQVGSVPANPEKNDVEFISPVEIGGQMVNLDFDTGSSDLWVFTNQLNPAITANHRVYDNTKSTSFKAMEVQNTFNISYGDGSGASGTVGMDNVNVGGASFPNQAIELATAVSDQFAKDMNNDGLMGLAFSKINTVKPQQQKTFLDNVKATLAEPVFTADLRKGAAGTYTFGAIDRTKFQGDLSWVPVNTTRGFWQFSSERFAINNGQPQPSTSGTQAIADTGTTLILADRMIVEAYYAQVQGAQSSAQGITFPCNTQLPDLMLDVGGTYMAKVAGSDINFAQVGDGTCFGGVQASPIAKFGIYGDIFFKSQFVAFNVGNNTLGLAPHT